MGEFPLGVARCPDGSPQGQSVQGMITILPNESFDSMRRCASAIRSSANTVSTVA
jgi:hypothetical protein